MSNKLTPKGTRAPVFVSDLKIDPNPGVTASDRNKIIAGTFLTGTALANQLITWPGIGEFWIAGNIMIGIMIGAATWMVIRVRKTPRQIAIRQFRHLGVSDDLIENVVIKGHEMALKFEEMAKTIKSPMIGSQLVKIGQLMLDTIKDFEHDPTDIRSSRTVFARVIEQTPKIIDNFRVIETRKESMSTEEFLELAMETEHAMNTMIAALETQRSANSDNNRLALGVDIQVTHDLLQRRTPA